MLLERALGVQVAVKLPIIAEGVLSSELEVRKCLRI
jgi:hypothetical protein